MSTSHTAISSNRLSRLIGAVNAPAPIDVRIEAQLALPALCRRRLGATTPTEPGLESKTRRTMTGRLLAIPILGVSAPVAAHGLMVLVRRGLASVITLAALGLPVASDRDILRAATILLAGLFRLLRRLGLLDRGGLRLCGASAEQEA
ncbi:hypothetical protein AOQ71_33220 [Bradyrhizobium manausense]|uniref:Uncharacterized protein n=1 Tax=Bradyrhizobium manausense TaxID=989370 RepID=A0A0R3DAK0_9BRAD|nr:hypothetical protein AOQ71_33220 [Bradyrhizobium manausense]